MHPKQKIATNLKKKKEKKIETMLSKRLKILYENLKIYIHIQNDLFDFNNNDRKGLQNLNDLI